MKAAMTNLYQSVFEVLVEHRNKYWLGSRNIGYLSLGEGDRRLLPREKVYQEKGSQQIKGREIY